MDGPHHRGSGQHPPQIHYIHYALVAAAVVHRMHDDIFEYQGKLGAPSYATSQQQDVILV
jgi:hypothetical protein